MLQYHSYPLDPGTGLQALLPARHCLSSNWMLLARTSVRVASFWPLCLIAAYYGDFK